MNPLLHQLVRQHEAELRAQAAEARSGRPVPLRARRSRVARALGAVIARARLRRPEVVAERADGPASYSKAGSPAAIRVVRRDRPGRALAWRNATRVDTESLQAAPGREETRPWQADVACPLTLVKTPVERRD